MQNSIYRDVNMMYCQPAVVLLHLRQKQAQKLSQDISVFSANFQIL